MKTLLSLLHPKPAIHSHPLVPRMTAFHLSIHLFSCPDRVSKLTILSDSAIGQQFQFPARDETKRNLRQRLPPPRHNLQNRLVGGCRGFLLRITRPQHGREHDNSLCDRPRPCSTLHPSWDQWDPDLESKQVQCVPLIWDAVLSSKNPPYRRKNLISLY